MLDYNSLVEHLKNNYPDKEPLDVPDFHPDAWVKVIRGSDLDLWREYLDSAAGSLEDKASYWGVVALINEDGNPLFPVEWDNKDEAVKQVEEYVNVLQSLPFTIFNNVIGRIYSVNRLNEGAEQEEKND